MPNSYTRAQSVCSFLSRFKAKGENECWLWDGCTYNGGSGSFYWRGKMRGTNIVAWEIANGTDVPKGLNVCHSCDVRLCVNPRHLWLGTDKENTLDMWKKQRHPGMSLTPDQVRKVRKLLKTMVQADIARKFKVPPGVISKIKLGKTYQFVD